MGIRDLTPWTRGRQPSVAGSDFHPLHTLHEQMDRVFDDFFRGFDLAPLGRATRDGAFLAPRIDASESDKEYRFSVELPGVDEKDMEVTLSHCVLTIKGEKRVESRKEKDHYLRTERSYGAFRRSFSLPSDTDEEKVGASVNKGILTVTVARNADGKTAPKSIEVRKAT